MARVILDDRFQSQLIPLSAEERFLLEESILKNGCRDPLTVMS
jgi:hypothetical protein